MVSEYVIPSTEILVVSKQAIPSTEVPLVSEQVIPSTEVLVVSSHSSATTGPSNPPNTRTALEARSRSHRRVTRERFNKQTNQRQRRVPAVLSALPALMGWRQIRRHSHCHAGHVSPRVSRSSFRLPPPTSPVVLLVYGGNSLALKAWGYNSVCHSVWLFL